MNIKITSFAYVISYRQALNTSDKKRRAQCRAKFPLHSLYLFTSSTY